MRIMVNGEPREARGGWTLLELLRAMGVEKDRIAVELNGRVVRARELDAVALKERDRVEIVRFVGGG